MTASKFLVYWSLTFAILMIWIFSIAVALADVKDEFWEKIRKQGAGKKSALRPTDPLAGRSVAETLTPPAMDARQEWVFGLVSQLARTLGLTLKILVLQDSMDHFLVHFAQGKKLTSYRVDKEWVADGMAGKADQIERARERIRQAIERHLRVEFLGEKPALAVPPSQPSGSAKSA
jgi:hypothetical protein